MHRLFLHCIVDLWLLAARVNTATPRWSPSAQSRAFTPARDHPRMHSRYLQRTEAISRTFSDFRVFPSTLTSLIPLGFQVGVLFLQSLNHFQRYAYVRLAATRKAKMTKEKEQIASLPPPHQPQTAPLVAAGTPSNRSESSLGGG